MKEWGVTDDDSGESMEEVPLIGLDESELERLVCGWWTEAWSWFYRDKGKYNAMSNLLFIEKMI